ncbi:VOC family protein OS=Streptomyces cyaneofuscatus OX=66883 GN=G3I52_01370 PE=4 SV=1 [Streptomyces cyaneofuscatus]
MTGSDPYGLLGSAPDGQASTCWVTLMTRHREKSREHLQVLGWSFRPGRLGSDFSVAYHDQVPVASLAVSSAFQVAVAWTPYFSVEDANMAAGAGPRAQRDRGGGPADARQGARGAGLGPGRGVARPVGAHRTSTSPQAPADHAHSWLRLRTRNAFDAAIFYGEVLDWASGRPGGCDVAYEGEEVIVRCEGHPLARVGSGAVETAVDPLVRPHWQVQFPVADLSPEKIHLGRRAARRRPSSRTAPVSRAPRSLCAIRTARCSRSRMCAAPPDSR